MKSLIASADQISERKPYAKPLLSVFGEVGSLTATGSQMGDENNMVANDRMIMV